MIRLALAIATLTGCLPLPPEHTYDDERHVAVAYSVLGPGDAPASCPADAGTIRAEACIDDTLSQCFRQTASCSGSATLDLTVYTSGTFYPDDTTSFDLGPVLFVDVSLLDDSDEPRTASVPQRVDLASGDAQLSASLYPEAGFFRLGWQLGSAMTGNSVTACSVVGIDEIELAYGADTGVTPVLDHHVRWPCVHRSSTDDDSFSIGDGDTPALAPGAYAGSMIAYRAGVEIGRADDQTFTVANNGEVTEQSVYLEIPDR